MKNCRLINFLAFLFLTAVSSQGSTQESGESTIVQPTTSSTSCRGIKCTAPEGLRVDFSYDSGMKILNEDTESAGIYSSGSDLSTNGGLTLKVVKQKKLNKTFRLIYGAQAQYAKYRKSYRTQLDNNPAPDNRISEKSFLASTNLENISVGVPLGLEWHFRMLEHSFNIPIYAVPQYNIYSSQGVEVCKLISCEANFEDEDKDLSFSFNIGIAFRYENFSIGILSSSTRFFGSNDVIFRSTRAQAGYYF